MTGFRPSIDYVASNIVEPQQTGPATWVTAEHVAQHRGLDKKTAYRWRECRGIPAHGIGRLWGFMLSDVDEWMRASGADKEQMPD